MKILRDMFNDIRSSIGAQEYNESVSYVPSLSMLNLQMMELFIITVCLRLLCY